MIIINKGRIRNTPLPLQSCLHPPQTVSLAFKLSFLWTGLSPLAQEPFKAMVEPGYFCSSLWSLIPAGRVRCVNCALSLTKLCPRPVCVCAPLCVRALLCVCVCVYARARSMVVEPAGSWSYTGTRGRRCLPSLVSSGASPAAPRILGDACLGGKSHQRSSPFHSVIGKTGPGREGLSSVTQ